VNFKKIPISVVLLCIVVIEMRHIDQKGDRIDKPNSIRNRPYLF